MGGKIFVVGTGPGDQEYICPMAMEAMERSDVVVGYKTYVDLVRPLVPNKEFISSGMMKEVERCREVFKQAKRGKTVSLISSGDPGIYGMAGIMLELAANDQTDIPVEIVAGVSAASSAASLLGAPLMNDFVVVSLSNLLTPWEVIVKRLHAAAMGDFVISVYNPRSKKRVQHLNMAVDILLEYQKPETPVGVVKNAMREQQEVMITDLAHLKEQHIDMFTTLIIGNSQTKVIKGKMVTIRGYKI
ncbi:MAG: precorrin-3B C(17)-methyltransferase [Bacteroidales bacterium]|nr:precorrin-3B C(17)-methyltransferase [Bacteroidales bacterium]